MENIGVGNLAYLTQTVGDVLQEELTFVVSRAKVSLPILNQNLWSNKSAAVVPNVVSLSLSPIFSNITNEELVTFHLFSSGLVPVQFAVGSARN